MFSKEGRDNSTIKKQAKQPRLMYWIYEPCWQFLVVYGKKTMVVNKNVAKGITKIEIDHR